MTTQIGVATALLSGVPLAAVTGDEAKPPGPAKLWYGFPRNDPKLVQEIVAVSHANEAKVRELIAAHPALVNSWYDWGFGDWESPLGAASHVGRRGIALYLIEQGARIDIFAAAMLGKTDVVKAFVTAQPGVQRTLGPHAINLLAHARAGGKDAADTFAYLESLSDAGKENKGVPLPDDRKQAYVGSFRLEGTENDRLDLKLQQDGRLRIEWKSPEGETQGRPINYVADQDFFPAGVPSVKIRFTVANDKAQTLTILERDPIVQARRVE